MNNLPPRALEYRTALPTLQEFVSAQLKSLETDYKKDIWRNWQHGYSSRMLEGWMAGTPSERERREQIFFDDLFDKAETFLNQTLPQLIDTEVVGFIQKTLRTGNTSIGDFILSHLLPVQMDTLAKFVKFLRCSWTSDPPRYPGSSRTVARLINEYDPKTPFGLEGIDIGVDADTIQRNLGNQVGHIYMSGWRRSPNFWKGLIILPCFFQRMLIPHIDKTNNSVECGC